MTSKANAGRFVPFVMKYGDAGRVSIIARIKTKVLFSKCWDEATDAARQLTRAFSSKLR